MDIVVSVQVLNEVANVLMKKHDFDEIKVSQIIDFIDSVAILVPMTKQLCSDALSLKKRYKFSWFDALIVAAALSTECTVLFSEDLQHGMLIEGILTVQNPLLP